MLKRVIPIGDKWIQQIFEAKAVAKGGIVRRKVADVEKYASARALKREVKRRKFHILKIGGQYLIICNQGDCTLVC